jgi:hypothetical protein
LVPRAAAAFGTTRDRAVHCLRALGIARARTQRHRRRRARPGTYAWAAAGEGAAMSAPKYYQTPLPWLRLWTDFLDDPKVHRLPEMMQLRFVKVLCLTGRRIVPTNDDGDIVYALRMSKDETAKTKKALIGAGLIGKNWKPLAWDRRQPKGDHTGPKRQKKWREKHAGGNGRDVTGDVTRNVTRNALDSERDAEGEEEAEEEGHLNSSPLSNNSASEASDDLKKSLKSGTKRRATNGAQPTSLTERRRRASEEDERREAERQRAEEAERQRVAKEVERRERERNVAELGGKITDVAGVLDGTPKP